MSDTTLRRLVAVAAIFVIAAAVVFLVVQGSGMYGSYQNEQAASLDRAIQKTNSLTREIERRYGH